MDKQLLEILVCPVTGAALQPVDDERLEALNQRVLQQTLVYADGSLVEGQLSAALLTRDARTAYVVEDGIPVMLPERGIALD